MSLARKKLILGVGVALLTLAARRHALAGSGTWAANPASADWHASANWTPAMVPNGPLDVASFGPSNVTEVTISPTVEVSSVNFNLGAPDFTIGVKGIGINLFVSGPGIINQSGRLQSFTADGGQSAIFFENSATAGDLTSFGGDAPLIFFDDFASAGSATFDISGNGTFQAFVGFNDATTAAEATINVSNFAEVGIYGTASGGDAILNLSTGAFVIFGEGATADHATVTCTGGNGIYESSINFQQAATAAEGSFTALGGTTSGEAGGVIAFSSTATAANGTFLINGGVAAGLTGALMSFDDTTTAGNANITANGGVGGSEGGLISFQDTSKGGTASITLNGNSQLDLGDHRGGVTIGSLNGKGFVFLGANTLTIGSNNQSTSFAGVIEDSGGVIKTGTGTLILSGSNTYTGTTSVTGGVLNAGNKRGSATGTGAVKVNAGTLSGRGMISGAATIGTGSGAGAFLAPAVGSTKQTTLTLQSTLTMNADATYTYSFKARRNKSRTDLVIANGVTINGATINLVGQTQGSVKRGLTLTLLSNTSANPISGTFSNLPNGGIVNVNGNNFQASYTGGDGNDLTLTVVP